MSAIEAWLVEHGGAVRRLARGIVADDAAADDVLQETFARAFASLATFDPARGSVRTWLFAIARNAAFEHLRRRRERPVGDPTEVEPLMALGVAAGWGATPEATFTRAEDRESLARALAGLSSTDREVLLLRDVEGLSTEDAAALLGVEVRALKSRLHRARLRLLAAVRIHEEGVVSHEREAGGVRCSQVLALLSDYVDGDGGPTDRARIDHHLRACTVCERFGGRFSRLVGDVRRELGAAPALDEHALAQLRDALR